jgi:hypothetical protein
MPGAHGGKLSESSASGVKSSPHARGPGSGRGPAAEEVEQREDGIAQVQGTVVCDSPGAAAEAASKNSARYRT